MSFPIVRPRRLRRTEALRGMVAAMQEVYPRPHRYIPVQLAHYQMNLQSIQIHKINKTKVHKN